MTTDYQTMLRVPRTDAAEKLQKQISRGEELLSRKIASEEDLELFREDKQVWSDYNAELLRTLFTTTDMRDEYTHVGPAEAWSYSLFEDLIESSIDDLKEKLSRLRSIFKRLELIPEAPVPQQETTLNTGATSDASLNRELLILLRQAKELRDGAVRIDPTAADKPGRPGSGITELIKPYNSYLDRAKQLFSGKDPQAVLAINEIPHQEDIKERFAASYHKKAKQRILTGLGQLIAILEARLTHVASLPGGRTGPFSRRVFVVHGRDEGKREAVARFLTQLNMEPIILHEQPSKGQTLIEKIEHNSDVGFAVVLLTADDLGCLKGNINDLKPRARQNVVFELGYFFGLLGRKRVCALYESGVERPSDIEGVVYIPLDDHGGWKTTLAKELKAAGFEIDAARLLA